MTYREVIYMVNDLCKLFSDDTSYTEDHILFLINKYRGALLQQYLSVKKQVPHSNYLTISIPLKLMSNDSTLNQYVSEKIVPNLLSIGNPNVYILSYSVDSSELEKPINLISRERFKYCGYRNKLKNLMYCAILPDNHVYLKSHHSNTHVDLNSTLTVYLTGVFEDAWAVTNYLNGNIDSDFPLESALLPNLLQAVLKDILGAAYRPKDGTNDANDDLASLAYFIQKNSKSALAKQLDDTAE